MAGDTLTTDGITTGTTRPTAEDHGNGETTLPHVPAAAVPATEAHTPPVQGATACHHAEKVSPRAHHLRAAHEDNVTQRHRTVVTT